MKTLLQNRATGAALVASALSTRETVRITYCRATGRCRVERARGDKVILLIAYDIAPEDLAERIAASFARRHGLDVSRVDVL